MLIDSWAKEYNIPSDAVKSLKSRMGLIPHETTHTSAINDSEAAVSSKIRLEAGQKGIWLMRNNVGAYQDKTGRWNRYGLCNDSKRMNEEIKSHDYIGIRPVLITEDHVAQVIGQFVAREVKHSNWAYTNTAHERAQLKFAEAVVARGGDAMFANSVGTL